MIDQLVFQKHLDNHKAVKIFEDGSEEEKIKFCEKYLTDRGKFVSDKKISEPKYNSFEDLFDKPLVFTMNKTIDARVWEEKDYQNYFRQEIYRNFAYAFMEELEKNPDYVEIVENTNYATLEQTFTMKMYITKPRNRPMRMMTEYPVGGYIKK